jgi:hypothetical protein
MSRDAFEPLKSVLVAELAIVVLAACGSGPAAGSSSSPSPSATLFADTWTFDGTTWSEVKTAGAPPARASATMAFDEKRKVTVLFGGVSASGLYDDTWTFDGRAWTEQHPAHHPGMRQNASMGYDPKSERVILFGGGVSEGPGRGETWAWDGQDWAQLETSGLQQRSGAALVYDVGRGALVLVGGYLDLIYYRDEWEWDGSRWRALRGSHPPPVAFAAAAYDPSRAQIVLFGGTVHGPGGVGSIGTPVGDTWLEQGGGWTKASPATGPSARYDSAAVFDPELGQVVVFGGAACPTVDAGFWSWDGQNWTDARGPVEPSARFAASAVYDSVRHVVVLFGGSNEQVCFS